MAKSKTSSPPHPMLPVPDAIRVVLETTAKAILQQQQQQQQHGEFGYESVATNASPSQLLGRILAEDVLMCEPGYPPYRASIMDGYAISSREFSTATESWTHRVLDRVYAGPSEDSTKGPSADNKDSDNELLLPAAVYITTGAKIPDAFDCVVPIEQIEESQDKSHIKIAGTASIQNGKFIRAVGCDIPAGSVVLPRGFSLSPISLGLLQQSGQHQVPLVKHVTVGILSTGNELLVSTDAWAQKTSDSHGTLIQTGQIPDVNKPILTSLITTFGNCQPVDLGMAKDDDAEGMADMIQNAVEQCDVILTTGGISMGETDIVEDVLVRRLGGTLHFGRLNMKPGKPTTFITLPTSNPRRKCLVFALPGNPVSATVCTHLVVRPCLNMLMQYRGTGVTYSTTSQDDESLLIQEMMQDTYVQPEITAQLTHDIPLDKERPEYHRAFLSRTTSHDNQWEYQATSTGEQRSSRLMSLRDAEGLIVLPQGSEEQPKAMAGQRFPVLLLGDRHNSVRLKDSQHLRPIGSKFKPATRVAILQICEGTNTSKSTLPADDMSARVRKAISGSKCGAAKVVACDKLEGVALDTIGSHIHKLMAREKNEIDILVVSCTGSFAYSLQVSQRIRQEVVKNADAVALQARRGAASQDGTAALFEPVVGFILPESRKQEDGCMVIALPQAGLDGGLENVRGLLKHALNVARGKPDHHHYHRGTTSTSQNGDTESNAAQTRSVSRSKGEQQQQVLVVGRGIYALPILRILGHKSNKANGDNFQVHLTFGSVGVGQQDMGSNSRFVDQVICLPRPDGDAGNLEAFANAICAFASGKPNLVIIPVVEETMYLSLIADRVQEENPSVRIFTSDPDILMKLNDKYSFQKAMTEIHPGSVPRTSLVKNQKDTMKCIQENFDLNKSAPSVVVKPLVGHGSIGAHIIARTEFEAVSASPKDFQRQFPMDFDQKLYVVQEYVEGQELSTFSLLQNGQVLAHLCYCPRYVSTHGFSPIRSLVPESKWKRTLHYVQKVAAAHNLTGSFGFDFMERYNGEMVALECNPRVTNGVAFFSPRFSVEMASRIQRAYLGLLDPKDLKRDGCSTVISPYGNPKIPNHTMTLLPAFSCITKSKTNCESMQILELATQSHDDIWWRSDPLPSLVMILRILANLLYAVCLSLVTLKSVTDIFRQFVLSEVVKFSRLSDSLAETKSLETVGGLANDNLRNSKQEGNGLKVLVTGATGFLGGRVVQILNHGFDDDSIPLSDAVKSASVITATGRNVKRGQKLIDSLKPTGKKVQFIAIDLSDAKETFELVKGHDVVIHCAALCVISAYWEDCISANTTAAENIAHACHLAGVRMLVHVSTPSVCVSIAPGSGDVINFQETDPLPPDDYQPNRYSVTKKKAESIVMDVSTRYQIPCVILRPRALFGPGDETLFPILLDRLKRGKLVHIGGRRDSLSDMTYIDNVVHSCLCCLDKAPSSTKIYSITNDDPRKFWDVVDKVCDKLGLQRVHKSIPWCVAYTAGWLLEAIAILRLLAGFPSEPLTTRYGIGIVSKSTTFDISAAKKDLGYKPVISFDDGLQHFLDTLE